MTSRRAHALLACLAAAFVSNSCRDTNVRENAPKSTRPDAATRPSIDLVRARADDVVLETRSVRFGSRDRKPLRSGWSRDERNRQGEFSFVWAADRDATVALHVLEVLDLQFLVKLVPYPSPAPQRITIVVNGTTVTEFDAQPVVLEYRFVIPAELLRAGENFLTFRHAALTAAPGGRRLAAAYLSLLGGPNCLPLRPRGEPPLPEVRTTRRRKTRPAIVIRGPAELVYRLKLPQRPELRLTFMGRAGTGRFVARVVDESGATQVAEAPIGGLFSPRRREIAADLSRWAGREVELRLAALPDECRSATVEARIVTATIDDGIR